MNYSLPFHKLDEITHTNSLLIILLNIYVFLQKILKSKTDAVDVIADFVRQKSPTRTEYKRDPPTCSYLLAKDGEMHNKINLTYYKEFKAKVNLTETVIHFPVDVYEFSKEIKRLLFTLCTSLKA